jgi:glycosyltransferase involved in cell wall biosynthesis
MDVSIIIPYNKDRGYLSEAIQSIKDQGFSGTFEIVLAKGDKSTVDNFNEGLSRAKGKYMKLCGEDDWMPPNSLQDLYDGIQGFDMCIGNAEYHNGIMVKKYKPDYWDLKRLVERNTINGGAIMYRTEIVKAIGGMNPELWTGEEYDMNLKLIYSGYTLNYVDNFVYCTRIWDGQKSIGLRKNDPEARAAEIIRIQNQYK